jgi:hypothetical protein
VCMFAANWLIFTGDANSGSYAWQGISEHNAGHRNIHDGSIWRPHLASTAEAGSARLPSRRE